VGRCEKMSFDEFIRRLQRPLYVWRMARHDERPGALTRQTNAEREINRLIKEYYLSWPLHKMPETHR
jgi:hypothetical protein